MPERLPNGIATMEARSDAALEANRVRQAIEARSATPEVSLLNDTAALEIFGSGNHTFTDPETGSVIASPDKPLVGKLQDIRTNPKYGKTEADRQASAEEYQADLDNLLDEGLELCQAKMIMDMRESDVDARATRTARLIAGGMTADKADTKASQEYEKKDAKRTQLIKENGAFTPGDYEKVRKGESLYVDEVAEAVDEDSSEPEIENIELEPELQEALDNARGKLAKLSVEMYRRSVPNRKLKEEYQAALDEYDNAYLAAGKRAVELLRGADISESNIRGMVVVGVIEETKLRQKAQTDYIEKSSDKFWNRKLGKFTDYWAKSGKLKQAIIGGGAGSIMAVATAGALTATGVGGLLAGAAALSTRVARSLAIGKLNKDATSKSGFEQKQLSELQEVQKRALEIVLNADDDVLADQSTLLAADQVERNVQNYNHENRKRLIRSLAGVAVGSGLGLLADNIYHSPFEKNGNSGVNSENSGTTTTSSPDNITTTTTLPDNSGSGQGMVDNLGQPEATQTVSDILEVPTGEGFENSLQYQYDLSDAEARQAYLAMRPFLDGEAGTYKVGTDIRISNPGDFVLNSGAHEALENYLKSIGKA